MASEAEILNQVDTIATEIGSELDSNWNEYCRQLASKWNARCIPIGRPLSVDDFTNHINEVLRAELRQVVRQASATGKQLASGETVADREVQLDDRTCLLSARPLPEGGAVVVLHDLTDLEDSRMPHRQE